MHYFFIWELLLFLILKTLFIISLLCIYFLIFFLQNPSQIRQILSHKYKINFI